MEEFIGIVKENDKYKENTSLIRKLKQRVVKSIDEAINLEEIERYAFSKLDIKSLSYYMSGALDEISLRRNQDYFKNILLYPKILKNVLNIKTSTTVLGSQVSLPILIAPTALQKLAHSEGELATARAAKEENLLMILSSLSNTSIEQVAEANEKGTRWFQLYVMKDRQITIDLITLAEKHGYTGIVVTVDAPILGARERDHQINLKFPVGVTYENLKKYLLNANSSIETGSKSEIFNFFENNIDSTLTWDIVTWLKERTKLKIILKGVHRVDDCLLAQKYGVDAIIVSNHGGRQLDTVPSTIEMLYPICQVLKSIPNNSMEVYVDGGFRRGSDVFKALAMGAKAVFIGRPIVWGLASDGQRGIKKVLDLIKNEFILTMKLCGCSSVDEITEDYIKIKNSFFAKF